jgi:hypothetical protein
MPSWFKSGGAASKAASSILPSSRNASTNQVADPKDVKISDLQDAMQATDRIVNDDIDGAEAQLRARKDSSSFHQLGFGIAIFMRSILGFEKDIMAEASARLAECETRAWNDMKKAQKQADGNSSSGWFRGGGGGGNAHVAANGCDMYPPGTEYQLVHAEAQLMGAMVSVMQESLTEGIKGFYKLRKAFVTLNAIMDAEAKALAAHQQQGNGIARGPTFTSSQENKASIIDSQKNSDSDSDLDFVDAAEGIVDSKPSASYDGHLERVNSRSAPNSILEKEIEGLSIDTAAAAASLPGTRPDTPTSQKSANSPLQSLPRRPLNLKGGPDSALFTNPVDVFVHSGANMCFGILLLIISMVPPAFSRLLYIVGFKGDRDRGVQVR